MYFNRNDNTILVIAPHADDETLGMGGTIAKYSENGQRVVVAIMTGHGEVKKNPVGPRKIWKIVRKEALEATKVLGITKLHFLEMPAVLMTEMPIHEVNKVIHNLLNEVRPSILFIPYIFDLHGDHRSIVRGLSVAWRPVSEMGCNIREIFMYETLSETHWNIQPHEAPFVPNTYVDISGKYIKRKIDAMSCYKSQLKIFPDNRSIEAIEALSKMRGSFARMYAAEAFIQIRRFIV